jgi:cellulose synthase operon protein B
MFRFLRHWFSTLFVQGKLIASTLMKGRLRSQQVASNRSRQQSSRQQPSLRQPRFYARQWRRSVLIWLLCFVGISVGLSFVPVLVKAQSIQQQEERVIREFALPRPSTQPPVYRPRSTAPAAPVAPAASVERSNSTAPAPQPTPTQPAPSVEAPASETKNPTPVAEKQPTSRYLLEFNRSPVVGNRLRLEGIYPETRLGFTRPRNWEVKSAKALIRFQHSPTLLANRSSLMVRVNDTSIGSVPLDRTQSQVGQALFNIPPSLIQNYNELSILAEQQTSETCTDAENPTLWSEILPDSKLMFDFQPQPIALDFSRYPYPFFDDLSLDPNKIAYLRPKTYSESWLTASARYQTALGRLADFRQLETRLVTTLDQVKPDERLVIIGTPSEQPILNDLSLSFPLRNRQILDGNSNALPGDIGVLMLTTIADNGVPVLIATGNDAEGVKKAVQFLVQSRDRQIGAGQALIVTNLDDVSSPAPRQWPGYLPTTDTFQLSELSTPNHQPFADVTVHGTKTPPIRIPFQALPDDRFSRGSKITLRYSYSPQVDPRTSAIEVKLDDVTVGARRLDGSGSKEAFSFGLPDNLLRPDSVLTVQFVLTPKQVVACGLAADQQLWGTVHSDTSFDLNRDNVVKLPDLKLLKTGFPVTAPQDLSTTAVILPDSPQDAEVATLMAFSKRMGRISRADSVKLQVYRVGTLPAEVRNKQHLVGIGTRDRFPFPEVFEKKGFDLRTVLTRQWQQSQIQTLTDQQGVSKQIISPWNRDRTVLALTGQTDQGLREIQDLFERDQLFSQLRGDTVLISRNPQKSSPYDPDAYSLEFLQEAPQQQTEHTDFLSRISLFLQDNWFMVPTGIVMIALLLYSFSQLYLNRIAKSSGDLT